MIKKIAFDIYQYEYGNKEISSSFKDLVQYKEKHNLHINSNEFLISGRVIENIKCKDRLFFEDGQSFLIKKIYAYGHTFENIEAGMTCGIIGENTTHLISTFEKLYIIPAENFP